MRIERAAEDAVHRVKLALSFKNELQVVGNVGDYPTNTPPECPENSLLSRALELVPRETPLPALEDPHTSVVATSQAAFILQERCPACFGGHVFGSPLSS